MSRKERVYSVLLVSKSENFNKSLSSVMPDVKFTPFIMVDSVAVAKRAMTDRFYDIILINSPLVDDSGVKFAIDACKEKSSVVGIFASAERYEEVKDAVVDTGVLTIPKPMSQSTITIGLELMCAMRERLRVYEEFENSVQNKIDEMRMINRAKWILIDVLKMTENDAHRYIEKQAMDRCVSKADVARGIINTYK